MNWLSNFLSFEKPMGEMLTRLLFYLFIIFILWRGLESLVFYLTYFGENFGMALWGILKTPVDFAQDEPAYRLEALILSEVKGARLSWPL